MKKVYLFAILFGASMTFAACGSKGENKECCKEAEEHKCCKEGEEHKCCKEAAEEGALEIELTPEEAAALLEEIAK